MTTQVSDVLETTGNWPLEEQLDLLTGLWERLVESGWGPPITDEQKVELDRRLDDLDAHPERALSWEQVQQRLKLPS